MEATTSLKADTLPELSPSSVEGGPEQQFSNLDTKKRLNAFKALQPLMEAVIAHPGTSAPSASKAEAIAILLRTTHTHLPTVSGMVGAESPWSVAMVASVLNVMARDAWCNRQTADLTSEVGLLQEVSRSRNFLTFSQDIGALDWNHQINDPLDGITAMRITALHASQRFIECVKKFDFMQEDRSEVISRLLAMSHQLAFSVEEEVRKMSPHIAINWRRSLLDRATAIVASEYDRIADFNKKQLASFQESGETHRYDAFKSKMKNDLDAVMRVVEKYSKISFATLLTASNNYMEMLSSHDPDKKQMEQPSSKGA